MKTFVVLVIATVLAVCGVVVVDAVDGDKNIRGAISDEIGAPEDEESVSFVVPIEDLVSILCMPLTNPFIHCSITDTENTVSNHRLRRKHTSPMGGTPGLLLLRRL